MSKGEQMEIFYQFVIIAFIFAAGCMIGWGIEVVFRRFSPANKERVWINPGFLTGPYLPLYGCGLTVLYLLASAEKYINIDNAAVRKLVLIIVMSAAMTLIEFIAGEIFIVHMRIKLWDYSDMRGNYKGIICPLFSFFWALLGAAYYFLIHPHILSALDWFSHNLLFSFCIGFFYGIFIIDLCYSLNVVGKIKRFSEEKEIVIKYEEFKLHIRRSAKERKEKYSFMLALASQTPLSEHLRTYFEKLSESEGFAKLNEMGEKVKEKIEEKMNEKK